MLLSVTCPCSSGVSRFWWIHVRMVEVGRRMPALAHSQLICLGVPFFSDRASLSSSRSAT